MPTFTTLTKLKYHLGIPTTDTSEDNKLNQLITEVEASVLRYLRRGNFISEQKTEYYDGTGRETLVLRRRPVTAVAAVYRDSQGYGGQNPDGFASTSILTAGSDYFIPSLDENEQNGGILIAIGSGGFFVGDYENVGQWPVGRGNIKVTYTAGYNTIPDELTLAVNQMIAAIRAGTEKGGLIGSETFGEYSYSLLRGGEFASLGLDAVNAGRILAMYREVAV